MFAPPSPTGGVPEPKILLKHMEKKGVTLSRPGAGGTSRQGAE